LDEAALVQCRDADPDGLAIFRRGTRDNEVTGVPRWIEVTVDDGSLPWDVVFDLVHDAEERVHVVERIEIRRRDGGPPASAAGLRAVPVGALVVEAVRSMTEVLPIVGRTPEGNLELGPATTGGANPSPPPTPSDVDQVLRRRRNAVTPANRADALALYEQAKSDGVKSPLDWVGDQLGRSRSSVAAWIKQARDERQA